MVNWLVGGKTNPKVPKRVTEMPAVAGVVYKRLEPDSQVTDPLTLITGSASQTLKNKKGRKV